MLSPPLLIAIQTGLALLLLLAGRPRKVRSRLDRLYPVDPPGTPEALWERLPFPVGCPDLKERLARAGLAPVGVYQWVGRRIRRGTIALVGLWIIVVLGSGKATGIWPWLGALLAYLSPDIQLEVVIRRRAARMRRAFPEFLDLLATCTGAGHSLHTSLELLIPRMQGPLGETLQHVLLDIAAGKRFWLAWEDLYKKVSLTEIARFRSAILEAEILGTPIANTLRTMATTARGERRNQVRARVESLPLKLSLCTIFFFLPPIMIVLVLPNLLNFFGANW